MTLDLTPCPGCGFSSGGVSLDCETCLQRHPKLFLRAVESMADELDDLRPILVAAEKWFLSIEITQTPQESDLALALRARNSQLGVSRGIRIQAEGSR